MLIKEKNGKKVETFVINKGDIKLLFWEKRSIQMGNRDYQYSIKKEWDIWKTIGVICTFIYLFGNRSHFLRREDRENNLTPH